MAFSASVLLVGPPLAHGQPYLLHRIDTLTTGDSEERNASLQHNSFFGPPTQWLVFERTTDSMTSICGIQLNDQKPEWRLDVARISQILPVGLVRFPDISGTLSAAITLRVVAWEQLTSNTWNIYYSTRSDTDFAWSDPRSLTDDTVDNTGVQLRPMYGGYVLATWRRGKDLVGCRLGFEGRIDTLLVGSSTLDGFEFDVNAGTLSGTSFLWVTQDSLGKYVLAYRSMSLDYLGRPKWEPIQIITYPFSVHNPWLATADPGGGPFTAFEMLTDGRTAVFVSYGGSLDDVTADSTADFGNPTGIFNPILTSNQIGSTFGHEAVTLYDVFVVERRGQRDTSLVFWPGALYGSDTLKGPGANRNISVGSPGILSQSFAWYPLVWESNRTGHWHLYGTFALASTADVREDEAVAVEFSLMQNYPNPFNPSTTIRYELPHAAHVTLRVYNTLGQEVATLVNETKPAGVYTVQFDAGSLASGVYFYRIVAGSFAETKRLLLIR